MSALFQLTSSNPRGVDPVELAAGDHEWIDAVVPEGVHESLVAAGVIDHPYLRNHEKGCRWVEDRAWWYRGTLPVPDGDGPLMLILTGVDTVADIWINGEHVGRHASQYRPFSMVLPPLDDAQAEILIRFAPPLDGLTEPPATRAMVNAVSDFLTAAAPQELDTEPGAGILTLDLAVEISVHGKDAATIATNSGMTGIRTIEVDHSPDLGTACRNGGMTMVRVWGGRVYASDAFMDACDENGILVWHDFMFAGIDYPGDDRDFMSEVRTEADYQTRRLANHPSLALWAGGNEVQAMHQAVWRNLDPGAWGSEIFDKILPEAVGRNSPTVDYWANSPGPE